jgi:hypothetical protein
MKKTILTISDGNGVDSNFKKWPFYLRLLVSKNAIVINRSVIGASNEMIFMQLAEAVNSESIDCAIIQWSNPVRLDVIVDDFWAEQAKIDPTYHFNLVNNNLQKWWVTSASTNPYIQEYHKKYISFWQAVQRSQSYMMAAAELLKFHKINFVFSLCYKFNFLSPHRAILDSYPWVWHESTQGLSEFRTHSQFKEYDTKLAQPHTLIQLEWIDKVLKPNCKFVDYDQKSYYNIEKAVLKNV